MHKVSGDVPRFVVLANHQTRSENRLLDQDMERSPRHGRQCGCRRGATGEGGDQAESGEYMIVLY